MFLFKYKINTWLIQAQEERKNYLQKSRLESKSLVGSKNSSRRTTRKPSRRRVLEKNNICCKGEVKPTKGTLNLLPLANTKKNKTSASKHPPLTPTLKRLEINMIQKS